ncbi:syntaxin-binding protein 4 [Callorhinchus milii]|uniref:syntaxin-binding protein 4 n=1 Tax=Callorhinchus milii TaxID=7868 RepID=UPI001C3FF14F|nr:syntaxin-binding protein 4 [Callorhinchus milii]
MGPYGINRAVQRVDFSDCENGLGISVIGGYREQTEEECGIYVKRILPGGIAAQDGRLQAGDLILEVNGEDLEEATNERAVEILRMASASNHMSLMIARDDESRRLFEELMENYGSQSNTGSSQSSPTPQAGKQHAESSSSSSSSPSPQLLSPKDIITNSNVACSPTTPSLPLSISDSAVELISVAKETSLGLNIVGGTNRAEGPMVYVQEVIPGRDCHKDGRLRPGDQLVSINKESLVGVTLEEAKSILTRLKLRSEPSLEIGFIRGKRPPSPSSLTPPSPTSSDIIPKSPVHHPKSSPLPQPPSDSAISARASQVTATSKRSAIMSQLGNTSETTGYVPSSRRQSCLPRGRRASLTPSVRLKVEKLETALGYLGIETTEQQQQSLRQRIQVDSMGTVAYGDFVQGARDVFRLQLDEATSGPGSITLSSGDVSTRGQTAEPVEQVTEGDEGEEDELESVKREWSNAVTEVKKLKEELSESERSRSQLSEELHRVTQEAKSAVEECRALRGRIHVAEAAQRQARGMEMDYEEVIHLLEAEITELKAQLSEQHGQSKARRRYRGDAREQECDSNTEALTRLRSVEMLPFKYDFEMWNYRML